MWHKNSETCASLDIRLHGYDDNVVWDDDGAVLAW